jgi:ABC transporter transmembrane region
MFVGGLAIAFWKGPIFTLICLAFLPIMMMVIAVFGRGVKNAQIMKLA